MTDVPTTLGLLTLSQTFRGRIVQTINRSVQLLKFIPIRAGEGKNVAWVAESDGAIAENYSEGADAVNFGGDAQAAATLQWALYRSTMHVTKLAMDGAATSHSPEGNRATWARHMMNACSKLAAHINVECVSGPGTGTRIAGLDVAIGDDGNIYGGINRASAAYWRPTVVDPGSATAPTLADLRDDVRQIYEASGSHPDLAVGAPSVFNAVGNLFDETRRQVEISTAGRGGVKLEAGYTAISLDGMVMTQDKDCTKSSTSGTLYYLSTPEVELQYLPDADQKEALAAMDLKVKADDGFGQVPLGFTYEMLAKTGPASKAEVLSTCQLVVKRPNACGVRKQIAF